MSTAKRVTFYPHGVSIAGFLAHAKDLGPEGFAATYDHPFLVSLTVSETTADDSGGDTYGESLEAMTDAADTPTYIGAKSVVLAIKHQRSDESGGITLGRGGNNDCIVYDSKVSKVHTVFRVEAGHTMITDPGSHNGTFVDGDRILPMTPTPIRSGNRVQFGSMVFIFLTPQRFLKDLALVLPPA